MITLREYIKKAENFVYLGDSNSPLMDYTMLEQVAYCTASPDALSLSNWNAAVFAWAKFEGLEARGVAEISFGHWLGGSVRYLLVDPLKHGKTAQKIESELEDYPILDEMEYEEQQDIAGQKIWEGLTLAEKVETCQDCSISIFRARDKYFPWDILELFDI